MCVPVTHALQGLYRILVPGALQQPVLGLMVQNVHNQVQTSEGLAPLNLVQDLVWFPGVMHQDQDHRFTCPICEHIN